MNKRKKFSPGGCFSYVYLIVLSVISVFPLLWLLVSAFKSSGEMLAHPTTFLPIDWTLENFKTVLFTLKFTVNIKNSLIVALCTTVIATFISALAAYGIIRFFPKLGNIMTKILITTYMFPSIMLVIPYAVVMNVLHLTNSRVGLVLVYMSFSVPYAVWMLVGFSRRCPSTLRSRGGSTEPTGSRYSPASCCLWSGPASSPPPSMCSSTRGTSSSTPCCW